MPETTTPDTHSRFCAFLDRHGARYRLLEHEPEGRTEIVSPMRGNRLAQAAKSLILMVKTGRKETTYVLGVIPGDTRIDLDAVKALKQAKYASFASPEIAQQLAGSVLGSVLPFAFDPRLELIVDHGLLQHDELYFNAARLDRSVALATSDYLRLAKPRVEHIAQPFLE